MRRKALVVLPVVTSPPTSPYNRQHQSATPPVENKGEFGIVLCIGEDSYPDASFPQNCRTLPARWGLHPKMRIHNCYPAIANLSTWLQLFLQPRIGNRKQHNLARFEVAIDNTAYATFAKLSGNTLKHRQFASAVHGHCQ